MDFLACGKAAQFVLDSVLNLHALVELHDNIDGEHTPTAKFIVSGNTVTYTLYTVH
jgi:hypothetical protein